MVEQLFVITLGNQLACATIYLKPKCLRISGIFVDNAMSLIPVPTPSNAQVLQYFERTMKDALAVGLTSIHDAATSLDDIEFYME